MKKEIKNASVEAVEAYEAPKCEVMELQAEGALLQSSIGGGSGLEPGKDDGDVDWGDDGGWSVNSRRNR